MNNKRNELILSQLMMPSQANVAGNVHGGEIMKLMDTAAGAVAIKYSKGNAVTARVDAMEFHIPIFVGALLTIEAIIAYVGRTSMEVFVTVYVEDVASVDKPQLALEAVFTMVALDKSGRPKEVNPLIPETEEEKIRYERAKQKRENRNCACQKISK